MALTGDVKALIQANNGNVLAGTNDSARIYLSSDNGQNFTQIISLGSGADSVNAFTKIRNSNLVFAAVTGSSNVQGIWRSLDNGLSWSRVLSHPDLLGYLDITSIQGGSRLVAVGPGVTDANTSSPIVYSGNQGSAWVYLPTVDFTHPFMAVDSYREGVLYTLYPGEPYQGLAVFIGANTLPTATYGINIVAPTNNQVVALSSVGGSMGLGGLDMASFLYKNPSSSYYRKALWAVKSNADISDTEIWQWPATPTGPFQFAKISTIQDENFQGLYVDTLPDFTSSQRTIWAGGNGSIYVSYNSGLTWAVATDAPSGQIYSFVRTSSGVLIAGGASGEIFLFSGSGSEGGGTGGGDEEEPPTSELATSKILGSEATCENNVYASNKFSFSNITHVFHYNGSSYSNLQFGALFPYSFLGTTASVNKAAYFGSKTNDLNVPGGRFSSVVFDITQESVDIGVFWEYWNGSSWVTLTVQDNTNQFKNKGVNSVSWDIPTNWATVSVNSVTAYWVRARISSVSSNPQTPIQDNRYIYTVLLPYIEIAENEISGDIPAVGRINWTNRTSLDIERFVCGLRSIDRGPNFNAYINISDVQSPFGLSIEEGSLVGVNWQDDSRSPTGRSLSISYSDIDDTGFWTDLASITLSNTIARDYYGSYKIFLRCFHNGFTAQVWNLRLMLLFGSGGNKSISGTAYPFQGHDWGIVDLGSISIPTTQVSSIGGNLSDELKLVVQGYNTTLNEELILYDLILIPTDEWAVDAQTPEVFSASHPEIPNNNYMDIDSITNPKVAISALNRTPAGLIVSRYQAINNGPVILQSNQAQRLWFLTMTYDGRWRSYPETIGSVQVFKQQQYLGFRGAR